MLEFAIRSSPEGFKVRYHMNYKQKFLFIASEEIITKEVVENANKELKKLEETILEREV